MMGIAVKIIMIGVVFFALHKFFSKFTALPKDTSKEKRKNDADSSDTMDACPTCGTYTTRDESITYRGKYYCSGECVPK